MTTKNIILNQILTSEQRAAGLYLEITRGRTRLMRSGKVLADISGCETIAEIWHEADQHLNWLKSGIEFVEVK